MNYRRALVGGVVGGTVMTMGMAVLRALGTPANPEMMLGTMMLPPGGPAWIAGFIVHLVVSALIALITRGDSNTSRTVAVGPSA